MRVATTSAASAACRPTPDSRQDRRPDEAGEADPDPALALWSARHPYPNGQSVVTDRVAAWCGRRHLFPAGRGGFRAALACALALWRDVLSGRTRVVYAVVSRTPGGFLRDLPALLTALAGARLVMHAHGLDVVDLLTRGPLAPLARRVYGLGALVAPSALVAERLGPALRRVVTCDNFQLAPAPTPAAREQDAGQSDSDLRLVWNSNILASKGVFALIAGVAAARAAGAAITLDLYGEPSGDAVMGADAVRARLKALEAPYLRRRGACDPHAMIAAVERADAVCLLSWRECQPLAVIDAMGAGRALFLNDRPELRLTAGDYPAVWVDVDDPASVRDGLLRMAAAKGATGKADPRITPAHVAAARDRFSPDRFDRRMRTLLC